ncbi:globin [Thozetella sp. PMI_491]|nr:globin [Thozetella sp. PMI_491]
MALSYQQALLVKGTIPALRERGETITSIFYDNMLRDHPELNDIFNRVNLVNGRQPRALCAVILSFASNINNISELIPRLERMCNKHCSLGIQPEHYELVAKYLIQAFSEVLGPAMTPAVREAWTKAYYMLARMLCAREAQIYGSFGKWDGWRKFRIDRKVCETDDMWSFYLVPHDGKAIPSYMPGQYVSVQFHVPEMGHNQIRQYSLSDAPRSDCYRITIERDEGARHTNAVSMCYFNPGIVSNIMVDDLHVGSVVNLSHPSGEFFLDTTAFSSVPLILISSGIGAAPLVAIANAALEAQATRRVSWIQGAKSLEAMPFRQHLAKMARSYKGLSVKHFPDRVGSEPDAPAVAGQEFLDQVSADTLGLDHGGSDYYVCGPEEFIASVSAYLVARGVPRTRLHLEVFSTGDPATKRTKPAPNPQEPPRECPFR